MKRIAILRCLESNSVCTGHACLNAWQHRTGAFSHYGDEPIELVAFWSCNGCGPDALKNQQGIEEKIAKIIALAPAALHVGKCAYTRNAQGESVLCPVMERIIKRLEGHGIEVVCGTHR